MIVDDHPVARDGLAMRIGIEPDLKVCSEAADVEEAMQAADASRPDVAVIDISLKTGNGLELIKRLKSRYPRLRMLVWSMYEDSLYAQRALRAGAMGYINKEHVTDTIVDAIRCILRGDIYLCPETSKMMLNRVVQGDHAVGRLPTEVLSDRELETFALIGRGKTTLDIAKTMQLSPKTIETYRARIKQKLAIEDMAALTREAAQWVLENG